MRCFINRWVATVVAVIIVVIVVTCAIVVIIFTTVVVIIVATAVVVVVVVVAIISNIIAETRLWGVIKSAIITIRAVALFVKFTHSWPS